MIGYGGPKIMCLNFSRKKLAFKKQGILLAVMCALLFRRLFLDSSFPKLRIFPLKTSSIWKIVYVIRSAGPCVKIMIFFLEMTKLHKKVSQSLYKPNKATWLHYKQSQYCSL